MRALYAFLSLCVILSTSIQAGQPNISTIAGTGTAGNAGDNGPAVSALLSSPAGIGLDAAGNLYICDSGNHSIRRISPGGTITLIAGTGASGFGGDSGPATAAQLNRPIDIFVATNGDYYIADRGNHRIRLVTASTGNITTIAGTGTAGSGGDGGPATAAQLSSPSGVFVSGGEIFISDAGNNRIRKISGGTISTIAGTGTAGFSGDSGPAISAQIDLVAEAFGFPETCGIVKDSSGNIYFSDTGNVRMRKIDSGGTITTFAGNGTFGVSDFTGLTLASNGDVLVADTVGHKIQRAASGTGTLTIIAGTGTLGFSGDGGPAELAQLRDPYATAVDASGAIYIADTFNNRIRKIAAPPVAITASQNPVRVGVEATFTFGLTFMAPLTWNFGDGTPTVQGNPVTHTYATEGIFTVTSTDGAAVANTLSFETIAPNAGAAGVQNAAVNSTVTNPLNGIAATVAFSDGGVVELNLDVSALNRAAATAETSFDDIPTRRSISKGPKPAHKFTKAGIFTATITAKDSADGTVRGQGRRTLAVGSRETGESGALPAPSSSTVTLKTLKGKFLFTSDKPDSVSFSGEIKLPAGFDPLKPDGYSFSIGIGNVVDTVQLDAKGKGVLPSSGVLLKKVAVKYPKLAKGTLVTTDGQIAKIQATISIKDLDTAGFDTEGITNTKLTSEAALKSVPRTIQLQVLLGGIPYEVLAPVDYTLTKKSDAGSIKGRKAN